MNWKALFRSKDIDQIIAELTSAQDTPRLKRTLGVWDLTTFGIAAVLGAGIFSTIGNAAAAGGPAIIFLFIFTAIACGFCAFCYSEFATVLPVAGSAYTYAYASFGELIAWVIGWNLLMEYAISNIVVAISWSQYFTGLLAGYGILIPKYLTMDFLSAYRGHEHISALIAQGQSFSNLLAEPFVLKGYTAWIDAPRLFGLPIICDLPALVVNVLITWIVFIGIEDSKRFSQVVVVLKILVLLLVIGIGATYVRPENWIPFAPKGAKGVLTGISGVFFAYIGFDAISTTAEECKNPQRDLPKGMMYSLVICTVLYAILSLILTGIVDYRKLGVGDPLAFIFGPEGANLPWVSGIVAISAVITLSAVLLVYQLGQARIWMAMSRDGLLPPVFAAIHPKYKTPWVSTLFAGVLVAVPSLFLNLTEVTELSSIGTLFAFVVVCVGALKLKHKKGGPRKFRTPYINSKYAFPVLLAATLGIVAWCTPDAFDQLMSIEKETLKHRIPMIVFCVEMVVLCYLCFKKNLSLIPVLGLATCSYLITELGMMNWIRFGVWLVVGVVFYFFYGFKNSKLQKEIASSRKNLASPPVFDMK